jgi:hypothetical protein
MRILVNLTIEPVRIISRTAYLLSIPIPQKVFFTKHTLSVSYNIFDGEELLLDSLLFFRTHSDHISVVYQIRSNMGLAHPNPNFESYLKKLYEIGLIDDLHRYEPSSVEPEYLFEDYMLHFTAKRNIGVEIARRKGHTHFMPLDVDEFYLSTEFNYMKKVLMQKKLGKCLVKTIRLLNQ